MWSRQANINTRANTNTNHLYIVSQGGLPWEVEMMARPSSGSGRGGTGQSSTTRQSLHSQSTYLFGNQLKNDQNIHKNF